MARSAPSNRVDEALRLARESHEMTKDAVVHTQVESVLMIALIGTLRDMGILPSDGVKTVFLGAAAILDRIEAEDQTIVETVAAARASLEETAVGFRIAIPPKGQVELPRRL